MDLTTTITRLMTKHGQKKPDRLTRVTAWVMIGLVVLAFVVAIVKGEKCPPPPPDPVPACGDKPCPVDVDPPQEGSP